MTKHHVLPPHVNTASDARNEYNDILADLDPYLHDLDGVSMDAKHREWIEQFAERLDEAVSNWVSLLGGVP